MGARTLNPGDPTGRGAGESLGSLQENASKHRNWYDTINEWGGKGVDTIDFTQRQFDDDGRVKVTKYDVLLGRSQPELQAEYERQRQASVRSSKENQQFKRDNNGKGAVPRKGQGLYTPQTTNIGDIADLNTKEAGRVEATKPLLEELGRMQGGALAIAELEPKPTVTQLAGAIGKLKPEQESEIRAGQTHESNLKTAKSGRTVAETNAAANTLTAQTNRITAINNQRLAEAEMAFKQQQLGYNRDVALYGINAKAREAGLDRDLRKDLAVLGLQDKQADRRYDRERDERKDRQMMIMQLLGGLKNLGSAFAL